MVQLFKIAPKVVAGKVGSGLFSTMDVRTTNFRMINLYMGNTGIILPAYEVDSANKVVKLGNFETKDFPWVDSTSPSTEFSIGLTCNLPESQVQFSVNFANGFADSNLGIINLAPLYRQRD